MCESSEQFSLRWNNFHSNLSSGFHALLQEEDLVDVTLAADGQFVQAHKIVLSVCSPYFKQLFKVAPCKHPIVILKDVCHKELVAILQFMYQGEVHVRQEELAAFLKTAEMLQIKGLTGDDSPATSTPSVPNTAPESALLEPLVVQSEEPPIRQYKRMRTEPRPASPKENSTRDVEYMQVTKPKEEPTDYGSDIEEVDTNIVTVTKTISASASAGAGVGTKREDPIVQLLGAGESSSHSLQETPLQGTPMFTSLPGLSQDTGGSQEGGGGQVRYAVTARGRRKLLLDGYCYTCHREGLNHIEWRCALRNYCTARVWQKIGPSEEILKKTPHTHPVDWKQWQLAITTNNKLPPMFNSNT